MVVQNAFFNCHMSNYVLGLDKCVLWVCLKSYIKCLLGWIGVYVITKNLNYKLNSLAGIYEDVASLS